MTRLRSTATSLTAPRIGALVSLVFAVNGFSQTSTSPTGNAPVTPVVQVVPSPAGGAVRTAGMGVSSLDLGHMSWVLESPGFGLTHTRDKDSFTISTSVGLLLDCPTADTGRRGLISAFLQQTDSRYTISLDGNALSTALAIIGAPVSCASTTQHTLQVRVPVSTPAGPINPTIGFQVTLQ